MAADRDGTTLAIGDEVLVPCRVKEIADDGNAQNVLIETIHPRSAGSYPAGLWLHSRQIVKGPAPVTPAFAHAAAVEAGETPPPANKPPAAAEPEAAAGSPPAAPASKIGPPPGAASG